MKITTPTDKQNTDTLRDIPYNCVVVIKDVFYKMTNYTHYQYIYLLDLQSNRLIPFHPTTIPTKVYNVKELILEDR